MKRVLLLMALLTALLLCLPDRPVASAPALGPRIATFSIVAYDDEKKEWGVATASCVLAVGAVVPWAKAGVGAIATQSYANITYGSRGLELLAEGKSAALVVKTLTDADSSRQVRQLAVLDREGKVATFTGDRCIAWAGGKEGKHYACVGNLLTGPDVVDEMAKAFEAAKGHLSWRLMAAMEAGDKAGGDKRGKQSAGLLVVREGGGSFGGDRLIDLRVDDHEKPLQELARILGKRIRR